MPPVPRQPDVVNFDAYEVHVPTQELFKHGTRIRLTPQAFRVLQMLLDRPGQLVTREEIRRALWPGDTFVDFDQGLNTAIKKIRDALCDSAEAPRYIETLPRLGYRFVHHLNEPNRPEVSETKEGAPSLVRDQPTPRNRSWGPLVGGLAVIAIASCIALATFAYLKWRHGPEPSPLTAVPLTALPGWVDFPAISPDGTRVVFEWTGEQKSPAFDLYVKTLGNENLLRLTNDPAVHLAPTWSPDGKQIAFQRVSKKGGGIYVVPAQGGAVRKLRSTNASFDRSMQISWSPDGKTIAFPDSPFPGGHKRLQLLSLATLQSAAIEHDDKCVEELLPAFSPDGKQLAYACSLASREGEFGLSVVTAEGRAPRMIKETSGWVKGLEWRTDGKALLFDEWNQGMEHAVLRELNVADGSVRDRFTGLDSDFVGDFSAKAGRLAYLLNSEGRHNIWRGDLLHPSAAPVKLISTTRDQFTPKYSPDGKHIVFGSNRGGPFEIWMSDPDGQNIVQLSNLRELGSGSPTWSPDSRKIAFDYHSKTPTGQIRVDIYIVDIVERTPRKLSTDTPGASQPSWSHDGKWIYFKGDDTSGGRIYRVPVQGGKCEVLTTAPGYWPQESLDGQTLYFAENSGTDFTLHKASLNPTGTESQVDGLPTLDFVLNWDLVPGGVYFFPMDDILTLSYFNFSTKKVRPIFKISGWGAFPAPSVSPDGRYILYAELDDYRSNLMLVENFH